MHYGHFLAYNAIGGVEYVTICRFVGYIFGQYQVVKESFELI